MYVLHFVDAQYIHVHVHVHALTSLGAVFQYLAFFSFAVSPALPETLRVRGHLFRSFSCSWEMDGIRLRESILWNGLRSREKRRDGDLVCVTELTGSGARFSCIGACWDIVAILGCLGYWVVVDVFVVKTGTTGLTLAGERLSLSRGEGEWGSWSSDDWRRRGKSGEEQM